MLAPLRGNREVLALLLGVLPLEGGGTAASQREAAGKWAKLVLLLVPTPSQGLGGGLQGFEVPLLGAGCFLLCVQRRLTRSSA